MILAFRIHRSGILSRMQIQGGWNDCIGQFDSETEAINQIKAEIKDKNHKEIQHWQLVNTDKTPDTRYFTRKGEWVPDFSNDNKL